MHRSEGTRHNMGKYDSILELPHVRSGKRPHMPVSDRAAQFAPFAALTGYGEQVAETARLTQRQWELSEEELETLNERMTYLKAHLKERPHVRITFFVPDDRKEGGAYQETSGIVRRIDEWERLVYLENGDVISMDEICFVEVI